MRARAASKKTATGRTARAPINRIVEHLLVARCSPIVHQVYTAVSSLCDGDVSLGLGASPDDDVPLGTDAGHRAADRGDGRRAATGEVDVVDEEHVGEQDAAG